MTARILIVDDSAAIRSSIAHVLELAGYSVAGAKDGTDAIRQARKSGFDLIITDVMMPHADGFETIRDFRTEFCAIPIIAMSGHFAGGADYLRMAHELGANAILRKPFGAESLLPLVHKFLDHDPRPASRFARSSARMTSLADERVA